MKSLISVLVLLTTFSYAEGDKVSLVPWYPGNAHQLKLQLTELKSLSSLLKAKEILSKHDNKKINKLDDKTKKELEELLQNIKCTKINAVQDMSQANLNNCIEHHRDLLHVSVKRNCPVDHREAIDHCIEAIEKGGKENER